MPDIIFRSFKKWLFISLFLEEVLFKLDNKAFVDFILFLEFLLLFESKVNDEGFKLLLL